jgi:hypothetical protein
MKNKKYKLELSHHQVCALSAILEWNAEEMHGTPIDPELRRHFFAIQRLVKRPTSSLTFHKNLSE